jgi:hypothetical protein
LMSVRSVVLASRELPGSNRIEVKDATRQRYGQWRC